MIKLNEFIRIFAMTAVFSRAVTGCATGERPTYYLEFDQDVSIILENDQTKNVKRGEPVDVPAAPVTVTRADHKSVVLLPIPSRDGMLRVRLPKEAAGEATVQANVTLGPEVNKVAQAIIEIQNLLVEKRADEALTRIQGVRDRYPGFSYLRFLEASCFIVKNDLEKALSLVETALKEFPDDSAGREFMVQITNGSADVKSAKEAKESH